MKKLLKLLNKFEDYLSPMFLVIMCLAVTVQIIGRVIVKKPLLYTEEIARYSYVWCVYLVIAMGEKYQDHFSVDIFVWFLKGKADLALKVFEKALGCVMFAMMLVWSIRFFRFEMIIESPAFGISMGVVAFSMCVGFFLCLVRRGVHLVNALKALFSKPTTVSPRATDPAKEAVSPRATDPASEAVSPRETIPTREAIPAKEKE